MNVESALAELHEEHTADAVRPHWEESCASLPAGTPSFLSRGEFAASRQWCGLGPDADPALAETARRILASPALLRLAWHCRCCLHEHGDVSSFAGWPTLDAALGESAGVFYLLVCLSVVPPVRELHRATGVPQDVTRETCSQVRCVADRYRYATAGQLGIDKRVLYWYRHYLNGDLFRVGRMEYMIRPFRGGIVVYRDDTGKTVALAEDGMRYDREGQVARDAEGDGLWTATLTEDAHGATGFPVSPEGHALRRQITLPTPRWRRALDREHDVLQMHIPGGGGMTPERCEDTLRGAVEFFSRHFPYRPFAGIACRSWIFNTQLQQILPPTANLVRFQRELYLFPTPSSGRDGLYFIFCRDGIEDWSAAPRDTSLQRAVADFLAAGNTWRGGGMFVLRDGVPRFGTQHYLAQWPTEALR